MSKLWQSWKKIKQDDPKQVAKLAEAALVLVEARKEALKPVAEIEESLDELKKYMIEMLDKADIREVKTKLGVVRFVTKDIPVTDPDAGGWEATYAYIVQEAIEKFGDGFSSLAQDLFKKHRKALAKYIAQHGYWDILQKRFGERACQSRWEEKQKIPGVKQFTKADIKLGDAE